MILFNFEHLTSRVLYFVSLTGVESFPVFSQHASFVSSKAASAMLSLGMTLLSMYSFPSALDIASWLNSIKCSFTKLNFDVLETTKKWKGVET